MGDGPRTFQRALPDPNFPPVALIRDTLPGIRAGGSSGNLWPTMAGPLLATSKFQGYCGLPDGVVVDAGDECLNKGLEIETRSHSSLHG